MSDQEKPFRDAQLRLNRARTKFEGVCRTIKGFLRDAVTLDRVPKLGTPNDDFVLRTLVEPTEQLALDIGEVGTELRSTLERMTFRLARLNGSQAERGIGFPIAGSRDDFQRKQQNQLAELSGADREWIGSLGPYKGGDEALWRLNQLRVEDFHRRNLALCARAVRNRVNFVLERGGPGTEFSVRGSQMEFVDGGLIIMTVPRRDARLDAQAVVNVAFRDLDGLHGQLVESELRQMIERVDAILAGASARYP